MKNLGKVFGLACVSVLLFSCSVDEYDDSSQEDFMLKENIQSDQSNYKINDSIALNKEATDPIIIVKRDN